MACTCTPHAAALAEFLVAMQGRKIRILALHGFRENGDRFRGRLRGLMKRMRHLVEIDFVTAPHEIHAATPAAHTGSYGASESMQTWEAQRPCGQTRSKHAIPKPKYGWFVDPGGLGAREGRSFMFCFCERPSSLLLFHKYHLHTKS